MSLLTESYAKDPVRRLPEDVKEYLDEHYIPSLKNLDANNPKLLVTYSGGNAVGKSSLSARIQDELNAVVLENDEVKKWLIEFDPEMTREDRNIYTWSYTMDLYNRLDDLTTNGLIVRDGVTGWYFDRILPIFNRKGYQNFIIALDISPEKRRELIRKRGDKPGVLADRLVELIEEHDVHMKRFAEHYPPDITLHDEDMFDHDKVIKTIKAKLDSLK